MTSLQELNEKFGVGGSVQFVEGKGGLPTAVLTHSSGSIAEVFLFGACVSSWKPNGPSGEDVFFTRPDSVYNKSKPIAGGIPICFPQFGPGPLQQHGFARNLDWTVASTTGGPSPSITLSLSEGPYSLGMWDHAFRLSYTVTLAEQSDLQTVFRVENPASAAAPFSFTAALHPYFNLRPSSIGEAKVIGLQGLTYLDKVLDANNPPKLTEDAEVLAFPTDRATDAIYLDAPNRIVLQAGSARTVTIEGEGWTDVVVWNPHASQAALAAAAPDFCCVERVQYGSPVSLAPAEAWTAIMELKVSA